MAGPRLFVTLEGYAVEGGYDQPYGVATCYSPTQALGRHAGPGLADDLWHDYERVLDLVPDLGVDGVRLTLEWARIEPRRGEVDRAALDRYGEVLRHARALDLEVTVVLVDAAWPSWLGLEAWLLPWVVPAYLTHARRVVDTFGDVVSGVVPFADADAFVDGGFLTGRVPPWRTGATRDAGFARRQLDHLVRLVGADDVLGPRVVRSWSAIAIASGADAITDARRRDVDELYVRSLLRGSGPTALDEGLLVRHGDAWRVHADEELLTALR